MLRFLPNITLALLSIVVGAWCDIPYYYVIIPQPGNDPATNQALNDDINKAAAGAEVTWCNSDNEEIGTLYWYAPLPTKEDFSQRTDKIKLVEDIGILPGAIDSRAVHSSLRPPHQLAKRDITKQTDNPPYQLKTICQKKGQSLTDVDAYYYDMTAGSGIQVYIIDSGLKDSHREFEGHDINWIFAQPSVNEDKVDADTRQGHGTSMASAALGKQDGVAKQASLTVVKADRYSDGQAKLAPLIWIDALKQVYDDVKANHKGSAVVSMSLGFNDAEDGDSDQVKTLTMALKDLFPKVLKPLIGDLDTPVFVTAGNLAHQYPKVNTVPAVLTADAVPDMVVVGGVAADGEHAHYYQDADYVKIYAPADEVETASFITDDAYENIDGTSAATAMTAGLVAYFMARDGKGGADARNVLYSSAYPRWTDRNGNGDPVLWNEVDSAQAQGAFSGGSGFGSPG